MMTKKHYLIYGHGGSYNHGGEAITRCTIEFLRKISPDCYITLSTHFPEQDREFGLDADEIVTRDQEGKTNEEVYRTTLEKITPNTTVIQVGGDNYCYANWQRYAQVHERAKKAGGKSIMWGCSIDEEQITEEMLAVLRTHDLILARESLTYDALKRRGLDNVLRVNDIAFSMVSEPVELESDNYVVLNLSPLVCRKNLVAVEAVKNLMEYILAETAYDVVLVPHVVMPADNDYEVLNSLKDDFVSERVILISDKHSAKQYKYIISRARLCVAARTHVTIAAYSSGVPTLAIGYSTKARGIAKDLGFSECVIDISDERLDERLVEKFKVLLEKEADLRKKLDACMSSYKKNVFSERMTVITRGDSV